MYGTIVFANLSFNNLIASTIELIKSKNGKKKLVLDNFKY